MLLCHLYPQYLNLYGDRGNLLALIRRAAWRGIALAVKEVDLGETVDFTACDIAFIGGGQDREQAMIADDLARLGRDSLMAAVKDGMPLLAVCGGYQLLGRYYRTADGREIPGAGILDLWTVAGHRRMVGNVVVETDLLGGGRRTVVGFENHSGRTYLGTGLRPFGRVVVGYGNNGEDGYEGAVYKNTIGTYLHGSLLPKNPALTDWLLRAALGRRYGYAVADAALGPLDDSVEIRAHEKAIQLARKTAR